MFVLSTSLAVALLAPAAPGDGLTLRAAVERVLARHPALAAAERSVDAAEAGADRVGSAWLPRVQAFGRVAAQGPVPTLSIDTGLTPPGAPGPLSIEREIGQRYTGAVGLEAGWRALDFGERAAMQAAAEAGADATRQEVRARAADLAWAVRNAYAAAAFFAEVQRVTTKALATAREARADAEARRASGMAADVHVAAAASRAADLEARLADAEAGAARAQESLRLLLGLPAGDLITLADPLPALAADPTEAAEPPPGVARLRAAARARRHSREAVDRAFWPTLDLKASGAWQDPRTFVETDPGLAWQVGAQLTWPLFDGDQRRRHARQLDAEVDALEAGARAADEDAARARAEAAARLYAARASADAAARSVEAAEVYLKAAEAARAAGAATHLDLERAADRLDAARLARTRARFDAARARADRLRADGVALESLSTEPSAPRSRFGGEALESDR